MCYYDYIRFQCGCRFWGACRKRCPGRQHVTQDCRTKRVYKHLYSPRGLYCKTHGTSSMRLSLKKSALPIYPYPDNTPLDVVRKFLRYMDHNFIWALTHSITDEPSEDLSQYPFLAEPANGCASPGCFLRANHCPPHQSWTECTAADCHLHSGHSGEHGDSLGMVATKIARMYEQKMRLRALQLQKLNLMILREMGKRLQSEKDASSLVEKNHSRKLIKRVSTSFLEISQSQILPKPQEETSLKPQRVNQLMDLRPAFNSDAKETPYRPLNRQRQEIRLYELLPSYISTEIKGRFMHESLNTCPPFTALSYTWGPEEVDQRAILVDETRRIFVRKNLHDFLRHQSSIIARPKYFWIDAICIDQESLSERNHQVSMMKKIYTTASCVYIWLGAEAEDSDAAMDWLNQRGSTKLRRCGPGYRSIWNRVQGKALVRLCERPYWRRMWIIQEIVHAERIVMWCGSKHVDWGVIEQVYLTLKALQDEVWDAHHEYVLGVLHSAAAVMAWQRAHWRHPRLAAPRLQTLIEVFQDWQCKDVRDKVFALVSMASRETAVEPDYSLTAREVFYAVRQNHASAEWKFENLLSQLLGLSWRDIALAHGQQL